MQQRPHDVGVRLAGFGVKQPKTLGVLPVGPAPTLRIGKFDDGGKPANPAVLWRTAFQHAEFIDDQRARELLLPGHRGLQLIADDIAARRDLLTRFLKASIEGNYIALTDEKRAKDVLAKELKITSAKILDITYNDFKQQSPQNLEPSAEGAQNILKLFPTVSQKVGDYVDGSLLDALKNDGFFAAMAKKYGLQNR